MDRIILFGASSGGVKVYQILRNIGLDIEFFVDNDLAKQGDILENKLVKSPNSILDLLGEYRIIIASLYHGEIEQQLHDMGIPDYRIVLKEEYLLNHIDQKLGFFGPFPKNKTVQKTTRKVYIDIAEGLTLGGIEKWSITVAKGLDSIGRDVSLLSNKGETDITDSYKPSLKVFDLSYDRYMQSLKELSEEMISQLPCVVIVNKINQVFMAAYLVKKIYGDSIRILSVLHSDFARTYEQNQLVGDIVDAFLCVSADVRKKFVDNYNIKSDKVYYKDSPVQVNIELKRTYSLEGEPIVLGYAGRLEKAQKRADLLLVLIDRLEELRLNYYLKIAGDGGYYHKLFNYIEGHNLKDKITLCGTLTFEQMNDFWSTCDVMLNLSDLEGVGLSMLEAMAAGTVPVVTDTAGAKSFIDSGINGYINPCRDVSAIADKIRLLYEDRDKLSEFGTISKQRIEAKCDPVEYIDFLRSLMDGELQRGEVE